MIPSSLALCSFWLMGLTLMTTLMLSPSLSEPELSPSDFKEPFMDFPREAELPGLGMRKLINIPVIINKKLIINK